MVSHLLCIDLHAICVQVCVQKFSRLKRNISEGYNARLTNEIKLFENMKNNFMRNIDTIQYNNLLFEKIFFP